MLKPYSPLCASIGCTLALQISAREGFWSEAQGTGSPVGIAALWLVYIIINKSICKS